MGAAKGDDGLTDRMRLFADRLIEGDSQSAAYRVAYDCSKHAPESVWTKASALAQRVEVKLRVEAESLKRRALIATGSLSERDRVRALVRSMALDEDRRDDVRLRAAELWGRAVGAFIEDDTVKRRDLSQVSDDLQRRLTLLAEHDTVVAEQQQVEGGSDIAVDDIAEQQEPSDEEHDGSEGNEATPPPR